MDFRPRPPQEEVVCGGAGPEGRAGAGWGKGGSWSHLPSSGTVPFSPRNLGLSRGATAASRPWAVEECHIRTGGAGTKQLPPGTPGVGGRTQPPRCEEHRSQAGVSEAPWRGEVGLDRGPSGSPIPTWQMLGHPHPITAQCWPVSKTRDVCVQSSLSMDQAVWGSSKTAL